MRIKIHRGTREIGGTCIEIEARGRRIALDVGLPLDAPEDPSDGGRQRLLPAVGGFREPDDNLLGVVISHPHMDHYGLARYLYPTVPIYIGEAANRSLKAASAYVPNGHGFEARRFIADRVPVQVGPFRITPYLVDHSAFDAYSMLVESGGKRLFYSGDFRAHGRKSRLFEALVTNRPADIDVLMMEGTTIAGFRSHTLPRPLRGNRPSDDRRAYPTAGKEGGRVRCPELHAQLDQRARPAQRRDLRLLQRGHREPIRSGHSRQLGFHGRCLRD